MDPLSEVLSLLKPRSHITGGFDAGGPWALRLDTLEGRIKCYAALKGSCWVSMPGVAEPVRIHEGDGYVLPTGRPVVIGNDLGVEVKRAVEVLAYDSNPNGGIVVYNGGGDNFLVGVEFQVNGRHAELLLGSLPPIMRVETSSDRGRLRHAIQFMMEELREGAPGSSLVAQQLSQMMLVQALRLYLAQSGREVGWLAAFGDPRLSGTMAALHAEPQRPWTVEMLARRAGMSRASFASRFRERVGESPIAYLTRWRMALAGEKLMQGRETLSRIGAAVGYESEHAFSAAFKRVMGTAPGRYAQSALADPPHD